MRKHRVVLIWSHPGKQHERAHTSCEIVNAGQIPCDLALAEDFGKQDTEDIEEIDEEVCDDELALDPRSNNLGLLRTSSRDYCF
jgi:hypothetical protein